MVRAAVAAVAAAFGGIPPDLEHAVPADDYCIPAPPAAGLRIMHMHDTFRSSGCLPCDWTATQDTLVCHRLVCHRASHAHKLW